MLGQLQFGDVAFETRTSAGARTGNAAGGPAQVQQPQRVIVGQEAAHPLDGAGHPVAVGLSQVQQPGRGRGDAAGAPADADPLIAQRGPSDGPAGVGLADHVLVGHEDVVEEDLVELLAAGDLAQRPHLDAGCFHVEDHHRDAGMLGPVEIRSYRCQSTLCVVGTRGPHLLPVDHPATIDPGGFRLHGRGVGPGRRLGEQLAPDFVLAQRLLHETLDLLWRAVLDQRQDHPAGDAVVGALDPGCGELLLDQQLLDRAGGTAPRLRPMRHHEAGGDQFVELSLLVEGCDADGLRADLGAHLLGLRRQVQAVRPLETGRGEGEHVSGRAVSAEQCLHRQRTAQMQVGVVLPGESDATVHLDVQFGVAHVGREGQGRGGGGDEPELLRILPSGAGGVPHAGQRGLGGHQHVGAVMLDGLERRDGPAELLTHLGIFDGGVDTIRRSADGLGAEQGARVGLRRGPPAGQHLGGGVGKGDPPGTAGAVEVAGHLHDDSVGAALDQHDVVSRGEQQHVAQTGAQHHPGIAGHPVTRNRQSAAETDCAGAGSVDQAGQ